MTKQILKNLIGFMERVPATGREAFAWCEAYAALQTEFEKPEVPPSSEKTS